MFRELRLKTNKFHGKAAGDPPAHPLIKEAKVLPLWMTKYILRAKAELTFHPHLFRMECEASEEMGMKTDDNSYVRVPSFYAKSIWDYTCSRAYLGELAPIQETTI